jgi:hypothetical protein
MPSADFFSFLRTSLSRIAADEPDAHRALIDAMGSMRVRLVADGMARIVRFDFPDWTICAEVGEAILEVAFEREIILDLIDGRLTMEDAINQERLRMRGSVETIERFHGALMVYLEGLIRTPEAPALLESYRRA